MHARPSEPTASRFDRLSWRWKLPLLVTSLLVLCVGAFVAASYRVVRASALTAANTRFRSALGEITAIVGLGSVNQFDMLRAAAHDSAVISALRTPLDPVPPAAIAALQRLKGKNSTVIATELVAANGVVRYSDSGIPTLAPRVDLPAAGSDASIGAIQQQDTLVFFWSDAVVAEKGAPLGSVRVARRLGTGTANRGIVSSRLGSGADLLLGNSTGRLWKGKQRVDIPAHDSSLAHYSRNDTAFVTASVLMASTPWRYAIEMPERLAIQPARALLTPFLLIGAFIALAGGLLAFRVSGTITAPLLELTTASEAIARGERNLSLVASERADEIGRLARAFRSMAASLHSVLDGLEAEVDARTSDLAKVVERLRQTHEELRQSERLASMGRLYGSVGHELRNPLGVMSNVVLMLDGVPDASTKLTEYAALLREQIRLSERIISELLDHARSGAPVTGPVNVPALLDDLLSRAVIPANIQVEREYMRDLPVVVMDRDQIGQIVWNLVSNAVQAMGKTTGKLRLSACHDNDRLRIAVRDTGPGVSPQDVERIFQPLYTTKSAGVGLGLSISREFARANGGDLCLEENEAGACFVLEITAPAAAPTGV